MRGKNCRVFVMAVMALMPCLLFVGGCAIGSETQQNTPPAAAQAAPAMPPVAQSAIDGMFPPAAAAKPFIDFDGRGFLIDGKRTFLASGSLHYARVPQELWRDRLLRMKRAGFNTVQTYIFWNFQEPQEGKWDFSGNHDLDAFLKLVKQMGMYATVRVGPYICAEWDSGGFPVWLRFKPGLKVRTDTPSLKQPSMISTTTCCPLWLPTRSTTAVR